MENIGEGGFATVYKARLRHENGMGQIVAVKALREARMANSEDLREFIAVRPCANSLHFVAGCNMSAYSPLVFITASAYRRPIFGAN